MLIPLSPTLETPYSTQKIDLFDFGILPDEGRCLSRSDVIQKVDFVKHRGVTSSWGGRRHPPMAFIEHGVAMLASVLNSDRAIQVSTAIIRAFVRMRELMAFNKYIDARVKELDRGHAGSSCVIEILAEDTDRLAHEVKELKALPLVTKRKIGFPLGDDD